MITPVTLPGSAPLGSICLQAKRCGGGGSKRGSALGPMLKSLHRGPRGGGGGPDCYSATDCYIS